MTCTQDGRLYLGTTSVIEVDGLADDTGEPQNDATVTLTAFTDKRTRRPVDGVTLPIELTYVGGSRGQYRGLLPHTAELQDGRAYVATIRAVSSAGYQSVWDLERTAERRLA